MIEQYSTLQAWFHDVLVAEHALGVHSHVLEQQGLASILAEPRERDVLDVGCGGGQAVLRLKQRYPHLWLTGVDLSETLVTRARRRAQGDNAPVDFEVANAQALPFPDESFDVVYSFGSIKHWPDPLQGIAECWRVLKAGGELLLTDSTSDATLEQVKGFYDLSHFPGLIKEPATRLFYRVLVRPARPLETYQQIATQVGMPSGTVSLLPYMPAFLFRTQKPVRISQGAV
jgi:ubiquinone/menaquinone biosynthesis C-methylase UbiE